MTNLFKKAIKSVVDQYERSNNPPTEMIPMAPKFKRINYMEDFDVKRKRKAKRAK